MEKLVERFLPISLLFLTAALLVAVIAALFGARVEVPGFGTLAVRWSDERPGWTEVTQPGPFDTRCEHAFETDLWPDDTSGPARYSAIVVDRAFIYTEIGSDHIVYVGAGHPDRALFGNWEGVHEGVADKVWNQAPAKVFVRC